MSDTRIRPVWFILLIISFCRSSINIINTSYCIYICFEFFVFYYTWFCHSFFPIWLLYPNSLNKHFELHNRFSKSLVPSDNYNLTSHIGGSYKKNGTRIPTQLSTENGLLDSLIKHWKDSSKVLIISADADDEEKK